MLLDIIKKGATNYSCTIRVVDSSDGTPETGVAYNTAGVDLWYRRPASAHTSITEATQTEGGAHSDGGFVHISDGYCRLDLPDAAVAAGADYVDVGGTFTDMVVIGGRIRLIDADLDDGVRLGLTAMPNAAADAAGGLPISVAGGLDMDAILTDTNSLNDTKIPDTLSLANINTQCDTALSDIGLDHLISASVNGTDVADDSIIAQLVDDAATADWDNYDNTTASLEALNVDTDAIVADTNELQTDWADGGRLDNILDARSSQSTQDTIDTNVDTIVAKLPSKAYLSGSGDADGGVDSTEANVIADALLNRDMSAVSDTNARSPLNALRYLRNKWSVSGSTLTITKEDDSTSAWTSTLTLDSAADPVTASDPA